MTRLGFVGRCRCVWPWWQGRQCGHMHIHRTRRVWQCGPCMAQSKPSGEELIQLARCRSLEVQEQAQQPNAPNVLCHHSTAGTAGAAGRTLARWLHKPYLACIALGPDGSIMSAGPALPLVLMGAL